MQYFVANKKPLFYSLEVALFIFLMYVGKIIASSDDKFIILGLCLVGAFIIFQIDFELFIMSTLVINHEFFYLAPRDILGTANYQDILYLMLPLILSTYVVKRLASPPVFYKFIVVFFLIIIIAVITPILQGQSLMLGLKAAKGYYLLLFYFVFVLRKIDVERLTRLIVLTGIALMILNNLQYVGWGSVQLFQYSREFDLERSGQLRFLMGDFFTIFAPIVALGAYLQQKRKWYLAAFLYMTATVFIQGQTRAVIFGLIVTTVALMYLSQRIRLKLFIGSLALVAIFTLLEPLLQETFVSGLFQETALEISKRSGNVGIRFEGYDYYWTEISNNFLTGRGVWNEAFSGNNPENMKDKNIFIVDVGIMGFLFHTGLLGFIWLSVLLYRVYRIHNVSIGRLRESINYWVAGYFIFSVVTLATLNCLVQRSTIIYLALALALISQYVRSPIQEVTA